MRAARLKLRLFLEGQEVPIISAVTGSGKNQAASASVQVIPTDDVFNLLPRTLVHIFFLDLYPSDASLDAVAAEQESDQLSRDIQTQLGKEYRLLFVGEFINLTFARTTTGRQAILQCLDFSSYWDAARQYFATGGTNSSAAKAAAFVGAAKIKFSEEESTTPVQTLVNILTSKPATVPTLDGLLGGAIRLLEVIGGVYRGRGERYQGLNDFFACAELRLRLTQTLGVSAKDTTSKNLLAHKEFKQWLRSILGRSRGTVTFRQILEIVLGKIYHEYASVLAPPYRPPQTATIEIPVARRRTSTKNLPPEVKARVERYDAILDKQKSVNKTFEEDLAAAEGVVADVRSKKPQDVAQINAVTAMSRAKDKNHYSKAAGQDSEFFDLAFKASLGEGGGGPTDRAIFDKAKSVRDAYLKPGRSSKGGVAKKDVQILSRLITHLFCPNLFFCAPPRCNVIFPDLYSSFNYRRSFLEEITRLELTTATEYREEGGTTKGKYYAPNIELAAKTYASTSAKNGARFLMPHEKFTGIIPDFQQLSDITPFQQIDKSQGLRGKIPYAQRVANFNFFDRRFGPRSASVSGHFNPYLVPALPALVMDQYRSDAVRQSLDIKPTQYLGMIQSLQHHISQSDGSTSVSLSHCRTHNERLEYLGPFIHTFTDVIGTKKSYHDYSADLVIDGYGYAGHLKDQLDATKGDLLTNPTGSYRAPFTPDDLDNLVGLKGRTIPGIGKVTSVVDGYVTEEGGALFGQITLEVAAGVITKSRTIDAPLEKAIFPPWFSPIYTNLNIGRDFYSEMLGIGSICDPVQFGTGSETGWAFVPKDLGASEINALEGAKLAELREGMKLAETNLDGSDMIGPPSRAAATVQDSAGPVIRAEVELGATVEQAVERVVEMYRALKQSDYGFGQMYKDYAWRPVATMEDLFGEPGFNLADAPNSVIAAVTLLSGTKGDLPREGFHSRAFGPYDALEKLDHPGVPQPGGKGEALKVAPSSDPRGERYRRVQAYVSVLSISRGLLG